MNCVCQNGPQRPGIQEVLDTLQRSTVCTGTQCFETEADAFGLTLPANAQADNSSMFMITMMYAAAIFGCMHRPPSPSTPPSPRRARASLSARFMMFIAAMMKLKGKGSQRALTDKPGSSASHANEPPAPPPPPAPTA